MSKVEEVARAIEPETFLLPRINLNKALYERAFKRARAAIEAMKGPTNNMLLVGWEHVTTALEGGSNDQLRALYDAMTDEAAK